MEVIRITRQAPIQIGRCGENKAKTIVFDISEERSLYGDGEVILLHKRCGDAAPYPCKVTVDGDKVNWIVTQADTAIAGEGICELQYHVGETCAKPRIWQTIVAFSIGEGADPPEPQPEWIKEVYEAGEAAQEAAERAEEAANVTANPPKLSPTNTWLVWDNEKREYVDTGVLAGGGYQIDGSTLVIQDGKLVVNTADVMEKDNTQPITSAAVYDVVGNINAILETI